MLTMEPFPFTAIVGQEKAKKALLLNAICPAIGGVLLCGEKGTGKSSLVRSMEALLGDKKLVQLPLHATEEMIAGCIDMEATLKTGVRHMQGGILKRAHKQILYIDEVNLLAPSSVSALLDASASGVAIVEREGISCRHRSEFVLTGTMNPEEGELSPQFLDRFGLFVDIRTEADPLLRREIIRRRLSYDKAPTHFVEGYAPKQGALRQKVRDARLRLARVTMPDALYKTISELCLETAVAGHRADIVLAHTSRAIAAYNGDTRVEPGHVEEASELALAHRRRTAETTPPPTPRGRNNTVGEQTPATPEKNTSPLTWESPRQHTGEVRNRSRDEIFDIGREYRLNGFHSEENPKTGIRKGTGRRRTVISDDKTGRYIRHRMPKGRVSDPALDATLRAAAPWQAARRRPDGPFISIHKTDIREKIREKQVGECLLFLVDGSGSMGANKRMKATKGAIMSLLRNAYQKRDTVGLIMFRKEEAEVVLPPTRSPDLAHKALKELPVGGKTPITHGLYKTVSFIRGLKAKDRDLLPRVIMMTDGKCNVPWHGGDPMDELFKAAQTISHEGIPFLVLDTEMGWSRFGLAEQLSRHLNADYVHLDTLTPESIRKSSLRRVAF